MNELTGRSCPSFDATPRVDLWCACPADIDDPRLLHAYRALLSEAERERQDRFLFARDRHRDLVTRALVRIVLSRYADLAPEAWRFVPNRYGRPGIANPAAGLRDLSFNITHGGARVIVAVARGIQVGVDTESIAARPAPLAIAERYFSRDEAEALEALPAALRQQRFYETWTLKEAYVKARSMGMWLPFEQVAFHFEGERHVRLALGASLGDSASRWQLSQLWPDDEHVVSVCAGCGADTMPSLHATAIVPWVSEAPLGFRLARSSTAAAMPAQAQAGRTSVRSK